jgi:hypothetical protein
VALLPINELPFEVFCAMDTQWRVGAAGATGLDYSALPAVFRLMGVQRSRWTPIWDALRVMERAALEVMHED